MKRYLIILMALLSISNFSIGQQKYKLIATVLDKSDNDPVELANVRILQARDSVFVQGTATKENGSFSLSLLPGNYIVNVSYLGYTPLYKSVKISDKDVSLGNMFMLKDGILLSEAVITGKAFEIRMLGDTIEYNADSYKVQESAVVEDLLKKMPGVEIGADGKITVNGKEVKKILVDGEEFFSNDPKVASKNLPAAMVQKLQVLDKKSDMAQMTGFDDGDEETVINLTVKPGMKEGAFGNAYAGAGSDIGSTNNDMRYEVNAMLNYMRNKNQVTVLAGSNNTNNAGFSDFASNSFGGMRRPRGLNFGSGSGITKATNGGVNFALNPSSTFKWGGNVNYGHTNQDVKTDTYTRYYSSQGSDTDQYETKNNRGANISDNFTADLKFEWKPDEFTQIIFRPNIQYSKNSNSQISDYYTTLADLNDRINSGKSEDYSSGDGTTLKGILEISRQLGKQGRVLSVRLNGGFNQLTNNGFNKSSTTFTDAAINDVLIDQQFNQRNKGHNWGGYISFVEPLKNNNFLQLTYRYDKTYSEANKTSYLNDGFDNYSIPDTASTRMLENNFINQQIELNFKSIREKYDYTVGIAVQPSSSDSWVFSPTTDYRRDNNVLNFSPVARFTYRWDKRRTLRVRYRGTTSQPTTTQLSPVPDLSDPLDITYGNPDLKPTFTNNLRLEYRQSNPEKASAFMVFGGFRLTSNDIVNYSVRNQGKRESTYLNVNGNWNANTRVIFNTPLRNQKFSVNSMSYVEYNVRNGYIGEIDKITNEVNRQKNKAASFTFHENIGLEYRSDLFDAGARGNFRYVNTNNSIKGQTDRSIYNYGGNVNATLYLPFDLTLDTDMNYATNSGYSEGFKQNEWLWNASLSKQIFKAKNGTIRIKIYDILQQKSNISQTTSAEYLRESITNSLGSYFMVHFIYRFQIFKGGAKQTDMENPRGFGGSGGGRPHRPM